jgi:hypothetical protein
MVRGKAGVRVGARAAAIRMKWEGMLKQYDEALEKDQDASSRVIDNPAGAENVSTWAREC